MDISLYDGFILLSYFHQTYSMTAPILMENQNYWNILHYIRITITVQRLVTHVSKPWGFKAWWLLLWMKCDIKIWHNAPQLSYEATSQISTWRFNHNGNYHALKFHDFEILVRNFFCEYGHWSKKKAPISVNSGWT